VESADSDEVSSPACNRSCPARLTRAFVAHDQAAGPHKAAGSTRDNASDAGRRHRPTGRWIRLSGHIAASLLPEAGDSRAVDGGEGR
jgi:hypothetical protein